MKRFLMVAVFGLLASGAAMAQGVSMKSDEVIASRQAGMAMAGGVAEAMKAAVQSGADVKPFAKAAAGLAEWADAYPGLFPDGTQSGGDTKAKAEIWSDRAGFLKASAAFGTAAKTLEAAAKADDKAAFATAFTAMGQTCGACHRSYRNK